MNRAEAITHTEHELSQPLEYFLPQITGEQGDVCRAIYTDYCERINTAPGSRNAHHAWRGGYREHVEQTMAYFSLLYDITPQDHLPPEERYTLSDGLVVLFLHDIEKAFMYQIDAEGGIVKDPAFDDKEVRKNFRDEFIEQYGLELNAQQEDALLHVEGVRDKHYVPGERTDKPLAALCHAADNLSARALYNFSKPASP